TIRKHLLEAGTHDSTVAARFRLEAQAAGRLSHPGIVTVYDVGDDDDCAYIAMEYVAGQSVREYLSRGWRFTVHETVSLLCQLLDALGEAHSKGVLHRDIKPGNLMITEGGRLKVTDFGIARMESTQITRTESILGSPGYMAPEQYTGGECDRRVDLFSAGVVLYRLLSGRLPYSGTDQAMMYRVVYGDPDPLCRDAADGALAPFEPVIRFALSRHPAQRPASAEDFRQALVAVAPPDWKLQPLSPERRIAPSGPVVASAPSHSTSSVPIPTGWNEATLAGIERELAQIVGPIAKVLVRRTAMQTSTLDALRQRVALHITDLRKREGFLASGGTSVSQGTKTQTRHSGFFDSIPTSTVAGVRLAPADVEKAAAVMVARLGPIAKVVARRCAAKATTREHFVDLILEQVGSGGQSAALQAAIWKSWE
ncbi:MAG: serine/threonine protein kinase, partial [Rhizobacter sp.]|nr:serine/threonine protein kinase [Rhizobacter sp.]